MKPLLKSVAVLCLLIAARAHPDNIEEVKELDESKTPALEAEESEPQKRAERCTNCGINSVDNFGVKSHSDILAQIQALPGAEVHSQSSFQGCASDKGCAGIKVKDGQVVEKYGNIDSFRSAANADAGNEFTFHPGGAFGVNVLEGGIPKDGPFWWMNQNSPFKAAGGAGGASGGYKKFSESSSSSYSSGAGGAGGAGAAGSGAGFGASIDLSANPFLNGDFSKLAGAAGFTSGGANGAALAGKPQNTYSQSSFESTSYSSSNKGEVDFAGNPFLNGGFNKAQGGQASQSGFQAQAGFGSTGSGFGAGSRQGAGAFNAGAGNTGFAANSASSNTAFAANSGNFAGNRGYTGSSPTPFTASGATGGSNVNLIQNTQKTSEFDFEQQQQTQSNIDEAFQGTGNVHAHEHSGGELQQTCAGQGYVCVHKAQCNNGVVNTNGAGILQAKTKKQYCNTRTEICCRIEISTLAGAGGLQGSLGVGSATFSGNGAQGSQGSGLFVSQSEQASSSSFGQSGQGNFGSNGQGAAGAAGQTGQGSFGSAGQNGFNGQGNTGTFESSATNFQSSSSFGTNGKGQGTFGQGNQGSQGTNGFGVQSSFGQGTATGTTGFGSNPGTFGSTNRGVSIDSSSSTFESTNTRGTTNFGNTGNAGNTNTGKFGATGSSNSFGTNFAAGVPAPAPTNRFGGSANGNDVVYKQTSQSNFVETDTFTAGSGVNGVYRPGAVGSGLKPGIPYLPPVDNTNSGTNIVSSTAFPTPTFIPTQRPFTPPRPYLPPVTSTAAPAYLPPVQGEQTITQETRVEFPKPPETFNEGQIILDETRPGRPRQPQPIAPVDVPVGCAAALKCILIEYCTAEGVISNTTVALSRDQETFRVPLTDCKHLESGRVGKCCRDPFYTDPWPTNQLGKWVPGVFGGNDGQYVPQDSKGSPSNRPVVTVRPPVTGSVLLNNYRSTPKPTIPPLGPNQVTAGAYGTKTQFEVRGEGQYTQGGQGQFTQGGQGQYTQGGQGQFAQGGQAQFAQGGQGQFAQGGQGQFAQGGQGQYTKVGQGQIAVGGQEKVSQFSQGSQYSQTQTFGQKNQGQLVSQGQGQLVSQGQGQLVSQGQGQLVSQGQGQIVSQGQGQIVRQGAGQYAQGGEGQFSQGGRGQYAINGQGQAGQTKFTSQTQKSFAQTVSQGQRGQGQAIVTGQGQAISQGFGTGVRQGQGFSVSQGGGYEVENEYKESASRVFLSQYNGGASCGLLNGQKPYGNRNEQEVDFAEIPWQAMVLLQTNRSLLCGGVITRPDVVITSASCVEGLQAKNVLIKGGEWKLGIDDEPLPFQIVQVKTILRHPYYKRGSLINDAAILVLSENLRFAKNIYPICLPGASETLDAFYNGAGECIVTGWGKQVLQAHLSGAIMHSLNMSLVNPGECQAKLAQDYPHLLEQYDQDSCACGQPTNPVNNVCRVDIGSALACTTDDRHYVLKGIYSWDSGCQLGNQVAAFYKFDLEWYEWAIGQIESAKFAQFYSGSQVAQNRFSGQINSGIKGGVKGGFAGGQAQFGQGFSSGYSQFSSSNFQSSSENTGSSGVTFQQLKAPISNSYSASYTEKKVYKTEPKIITYTTKPEIVTFTTKPEIFTYTTKPKIVTFTTKPQIITYETSGSGNNPQYVAPGVTFDPSFSELVGQHSHNAQCKCEGKK